MLLRRYMTLIEMIVVMAVLSMVAGVIGVNINRSMQEQRFRTEVAQIMDKLRLAQNLMLILNEDVKLNFTKTDNGILCGLTFHCPLNKGWAPELKREQLLTAVRGVDFKGGGQDLGKGNFALEFLSGGTVMSRGILKLSTGKNRYYSDRRYVCLPGFPSPIVSVTTKPNIECLTKSSQANDGLTQLIMPEILARFQPASDREPNPEPKKSEDTPKP